MNKQAYFRMMGLMLKVAKYNDRELAVWKKLGYDPVAVNNAKSALTYAKGAQGQLGFWEYIWNWIRRLFGSEEGKQLLEKHDARKKGISDAESALAAFYAPKEGVLTPDELEILRGMKTSDASKIDQWVTGGKAYAARTPGMSYGEAYKKFVEQAKANDEKGGQSTPNASATPSTATPAKKAEPAPGAATPNSTANKK